jgi:curved DNA-binding protein CbpA
MSADPYAALGVPRGASDEEIKRAYRLRAHETHPDREGGSDVAFQPVQRAYALLKSPSRRAEYDRTGRDPGEQSAVEEPRAVALRRLAGLFIGAVEALEPDQDDVIAKVRAHIGEMERNVRAEISKMRDRLRKIERAKKRLRVAKGKENQLMEVLEAHERSITDVIGRGEEECKQIALVRELLDDYGWDLPDDDEVMLQLNWRTR